MAYDNGSNGSNGGGPIMNTPQGSGGVVFSWADSAYKFTNPPRYYKANDPYYYEVDNIPLKQIQDNCLWLRDQISGGGAGGLSVSGLSKRSISDLKPVANGLDRFVTVQPGNFIGRVNDITNVDHAGYWVGSPGEEVDFSRPNVLVQPGNRISEQQWRSLVADITQGSAGTAPFGTKANGLFSLYTMHNSADDPGGDPNDTWTLTTALSPARWRNIVATSVFSMVEEVDLDMAFRRRWGGVFRTAAVNVAEPLTIQIPVFNEADFTDNSELLDPQVRIDLLCVYTVPIDKASTTTVFEENYRRSLSKPELVLVKGAGGILAPHAGAPDIVSDPSLISEVVNEPASSPEYYDTSGGVVGDATLAIKAELQDQISGGSDPYANTTDTIPLGSFPSPDDLLNLAPLIAEGLSPESIKYAGQTVLPLAYIVVHKNQLAIRDVDIIDIRPFMRTAELAYNERAGVAGAHPPLSLANPAMGKQEIFKNLQGLRDWMQLKLTEATDTGSLSRPRRPMATAVWKADMGGTPNYSHTVLWNEGVSVYDSVGLATADDNMSQVNGGDVFGFLTHNPITGHYKGVRLVRGKYIIRVSNTCSTSVDGVGGPGNTHLNWGGKSDAKCTIRLEKTDVYGVSSLLYPLASMAEDSWKVGPPIYGSPLKSYSTEPPAQSVTLTCNNIFDISDGDEVKITFETSVVQCGQTTQAGNISFERLPDEFIS